MSNFITISIPNTTGIKFGINVESRILYYATNENSQWTELTTPDILSQALVGPAAANKLLITNNKGDNLDLINFRLDEKYEEEDFPRANALPTERVISDFVNNVISNYFTKLEIESTYIPLPVELVDSTSYGTVTMETVFGGIIYNYTQPISEINLNNIESSSKKTKINVKAFSDNLSISVPNTVEIINSIPPTDIIKYVITIENNQLDVDYITLPANIQPVENQTGYWVYTFTEGYIISSGLFVKNLNIDNNYLYVYNYGRIENCSATGTDGIYISSGGIINGITRLYK